MAKKSAANVGQASSLSPNSEKNETGKMPVQRPSTLLDTRVVYCGDNLEQLSPGERTQVGVEHKSVLPFRPQKTKLVETTVLTPALSSEEREKTFAVLLKIRAPGFAGQSIKSPRPQLLTPLPGGEDTGEGERKTHIEFPHFLLNECILLATAIIRRTGE
jgi:hypothetical protein